MHAEAVIPSRFGIGRARHARLAVVKARHDDLYAYGPDFRFVD